jgi:hypothetical protein
MSGHFRRVSPDELQTTRRRVREVAERLAETEDRVADTFERLVVTSGDPDGHRREVIDLARRTARSERRRAGNADLPDVPDLPDDRVPPDAKPVGPA